VAALGSRLAVDLSGGLIRVLDGALGGPLRCGSGGTPPGALVEGKVLDVAGVGSALRQLLARTEVQENRALVAVSDSLASFRVLTLPPTATDAAIDSAVAKEFLLDPEKMAIRWVDLHLTPQSRTVYAAAWDRSLVKRITESVKLAGVEPVVVDLKSACVARAVAEPSCIVVDLSAEPAEIFLIDKHVPQVWHSVQLNVPPGEDVGPALVGPLGTVLRFYKRRRDTDFASNAPILVSAERELPARAMTYLSQNLGHPVEPLPMPARVPPDVRHSTYLTCLGLIMRRS